MAPNVTNEERPRRRATKKRVLASGYDDASQKRVAKKVVKKVAPQKMEEPKEATVSRREEPARVRKSPTQIAARKAKNRSRRNHMLVVFFILLLGVGGSFVVGYTDKGKIDVNQAIEERNERLRNGQLSTDARDNIIVPTQNTRINQLPDGGLISSDLGNTSPPKPEPVATTSSSTASTTESTETSEDDTESSEADASSTESETTNDTNTSLEPAGDGESTSVDPNTSEEPSSGR